MRCIRQIFFLAVATATAVTTLAGPPAFANPGRKPSAAPARGVPKPVLQIQPRFNPPQGSRIITPSTPRFTPKTPLITPTVPKITAKNPGKTPPPSADRGIVFKDNRRELPAWRRAPNDPFRIREDLDRDNDGVVDALEPGNLPVLDVGNADGGDGAASPPVDGDPGAAGPTAWDWVAIGLSAAALADSLADRGGGFVNGGVVVERPIVQTVPVAETVVIRDQPVVVHEEPVVVPDEQVTVAEQPDVAAIGEPTVVETPTPAAAQARAQIRVGTPFELPAKGLGAKAGRVAVKVGAVILECPVSNWHDGGLRATVADMMLAAATPADLIVALADGTVAARIPVDLLPAAVQVAGRSE
jgi:hypothetical protein